MLFGLRTYGKFVLNTDTDRCRHASTDAVGAAGLTGIWRDFKRPPCLVDCWKRKPAFSTIQGEQSTLLSLSIAVHQSKYSTRIISMSPPRVAIIGAGPAGSTLARFLIRASTPVTIFEGESSMSIREQGSTLDLHTSTGLKALREAGLHEGYAQYARYDGEALNVTDKNLVSVIKIGGTT